MSKILKKNDLKVLKYKVEVFVDKAEISIKFPCQLFVLWKRGRISNKKHSDPLGPHKAETSKVEMNTATGVCTFQEKLQISATIYYDTKEEKYVEKKV